MIKGLDIGFTVQTISPFQVWRGYEYREDVLTDLKGGRQVYTTDQEYSCPGFFYFLPGKHALPQVEHLYKKDSLSCHRSRTFEKLYVL